MNGWYSSIVHLHIYAFCCKYCISIQLQLQSIDYTWRSSLSVSQRDVISCQDYGYQINGLSNRTTLADGNTWNHATGFVSMDHWLVWVLHAESMQKLWGIGRARWNYIMFSYLCASCNCKTVLSPIVRVIMDGERIQVHGGCAWGCAGNVV